MLQIKSGALCLMLMAAAGLAAQEAVQQSGLDPELFGSGRVG